MRIEELFSAWKKEDKDAQLIKAQKLFIGILAALYVMTLIGWISAPSRLTIYVPPDISNGATLKANSIPSPFIYSFAFDVWQEINYWPDDGTQDYPANIHTYWSYLTPEFKSSLLQDFEDLQDGGQVQRQRYLQGMMGAAYDSINVKPLSDSTWEVDLKMRLTEYKNGQCVKDVEILYPLKVTRMAVSQQNNPYGLALAGFVTDPIRLKTFI
jgi:integrating conjugative element protein (TIGR03746 family)